MRQERCYCTLRVPILYDGSPEGSAMPRNHHALACGTDEFRDQFMRSPPVIATDDVLFLP